MQAFLYCPWQLHCLVKGLFFKFLIYVNDVGDDDCDNDDDDDDIQEIMMMMMSRKSRVSCTVLGQDIWGKDMFLNFQFM